MIKYGETVGLATEDIGAGQHVHVHNVEGIKGRGDKIAGGTPMKFSGYVRSNGTVGVRNHVLVFPTVICAASVAQKISESVPGSVSVSHPHGCGHLGAERELMLRTMAGFCANPNVGGVLLVGLGCELLTTEVLASGTAPGRPALRDARHSDGRWHDGGRRQRQGVAGEAPAGRVPRPADAGGRRATDRGDEMRRFGHPLRA